jgi:hypothetical protein
MAPIIKARCTVSAQVHGRRGAEGDVRRERPIAGPMGTVCSSGLDLSSCDALMRYRKDGLVLIPLCPLHRQKIVVSGCPLSAKGAHTDDHRLCITDDGHRTIPTAVTSPISPAVDRLSCVLPMAHRQDKRVPIPRHPPPLKNSGTRRHGYRPRGMKPDHHRTGRIAANSRQSIR